MPRDRTGRGLYFRPGHEEFPIFFQPEIKRIVRDAVLWAANDRRAIWFDNDPAAKAARGAGEPSLAEICLHLGYGGTYITKPGLVCEYRRPNGQAQDALESRGQEQQAGQSADRTWREERVQPG